MVKRALTRQGHYQALVALVVRALMVEKVPASLLSSANFDPISYVWWAQRRLFFERVDGGATHVDAEKGLSFLQLVERHDVLNYLPGTWGHAAMGRSTDLFILFYGYRVRGLGL